MRMAFGVNTRQQFNFKSVSVKTFLNRETKRNPSQCNVLTPVEPQSCCYFCFPSSEALGSDLIFFGYEQH